MAKIAILGAGMIGSAIARTLSSSHEIILLDIDPSRLSKIKGKKIISRVCDLTDSEALKKNLNYADLVIGAVPGHMGYAVLRDVISIGKNVIDISFFPEDASNLNFLARKNKVIAIYDCGGAPGMHNIILGYHNSRMKIKTFKCMVGGLPKKKNPPFNYKAPFSPIDVLEEYTRPARYKVNGHLVIKPALTDIETIQAPTLGTLEAFNSDGLRSLLKTMKHIPNMVEKTIRYAGHARQMEWIREAGLLSKQEIDIKGRILRPLDLTSKLLFKHWEYKPGEEDITYMLINIEGAENGKKIKYTYTLLDQYDKKTKMSSMARTTGMTACAAAELILSGSFNLTGVHPPETLGTKGYWVESIFQYLKNKGITYDMKISK